VKLTRRQLAAALGAAGLDPAAAQTPRPDPQAELAAARERIRANAEAVARVPVPIATEPAFQFRA
jgi:hypothetical protein